MASIVARSAGSAGERSRRALSRLRRTCERDRGRDRVHGSRHACSGSFGGRPLAERSAGHLRQARLGGRAEAVASASSGSDTDHVPVLMNEVLRSFEGSALRVFVDATLGAAGHAAKILQHHPEIELYVGIDADPTALALARRNLAPEFGHKIELVHGNFRQYASLVEGALRARGMEPGVDGILADLGVSSMQIDQDERGFSFMRDGPLDMRMDPGAPLSARDVVNSYSEEALGRIFRDYGEERFWKRLARAVAAARQDDSIETTAQLAEIISRNTRIVPKSKGRKGGRGIHPATRVFQAIRIEVNGELEAIDTALPRMVDSLNPRGRIGIISFHSLEDRRVKKAFYRLSGRGESTDMRSLTKMERYTGITPGEEQKERPTLTLPRRKPFVASEEEIEVNPRSRSAKYRCAEKV